MFVMKHLRVYIRVAVCLWILVSVNCEVNLAYNTKVGKSVNNLCLNNCINSECIVNSKYDVEHCYNTAKNAPVYHIYDKKENCHSRCVTDNYGSWCYTDDQGNWEYCNPNTNIKWVKGKKFTDNNGPCKDECRFYYCDSDNNCYYWCNHYWGSWDYCNPKFQYSYIQGHTYNGDFCRGKCFDFDHNGQKWCYHGNRKASNCALPALPRPRDWSSNIEQLLTNRFAFNVSISSHRCKRDNDEEYRLSLRTENLNNLAQDLEQDHRYNYVYIDPEFRNAEEPIYSWTIETGDASQNIPSIPRVVRAEVFPRHVRPTAGRPGIPLDIYRNLDLMGKQAGDHAGHLIAYTLHGPDAVHNFVPQMGRLNQGDYASQENYIRRFLNNNKDNGKVDMLVIPLYREGQTRPAGIAMHVRYYRGDELVDQFYEYLPNYPGYGVTSTKSPFPTPRPPGSGFGSLLPNIGLAGC